MYTDLLTAPISTANLKHLSLILVLDLSKPSEIWDSIENITSTVRNLVMTAAQIENKTSQLKDAARARVGDINEVDTSSFTIPCTFLMLFVSGWYFYWAVSYSVDNGGSQVWCLSGNLKFHTFGSNEIKPMSSNWCRILTLKRRK